MKNIILILFLVLTCNVSTAQTWTLNNSTSKMSFLATHLLVSEVEGIFQNFDAKLILPSNNFSEAVLEVKVDMNQFNTNNTIRDGRLKRADALDVTKYPNMTFKSQKITENGANNYKLTGLLTLKGKAKTVTFYLKIKNINQNLISFDASGAINLTDFDIGGFPMGTVGDEVRLKASAEFNRK